MSPKPIEYTGDTRLLSSPWQAPLRWLPEYVLLHYPSQEALINVVTVMHLNLQLGRHICLVVHSPVLTPPTHHIVIYRSLCRGPAAPADTGRLWQVLARLPGPSVWESAVVQLPETGLCSGAPTGGVGGTCCVLWPWGDGDVFLPDRVTATQIVFGLYWAIRVWSR
jgi:hypothetical protein